MKISSEKHKKYLDYYKNLQKSDTEYWGLGIENESYLMFKDSKEFSREFVIKNHTRDRYSVNYWKNYKEDILKETFERISGPLMLPLYINGYQFQNCDISGEHKILYTKIRKENPKFSGQTIDEFLKERSPVFKILFEKNMIYDGDTFEFTTFKFYKTNVKSVIQELNYIKMLFLDEINTQRIFKDEVIYPAYNYGFANFQTNLKNLAICNNGTYHINITLPTELNSEGEIKNLETFKNTHANAIRAIQWIEPLLCALYGSPDILHMLNSSYTGGSQRLGLSRYIGLGTYNTHTMEKGKLLDSFDPKNTYLNELHKESPYILPETTGYDFNYNKFTKHGIELRIFDYFPEEYLESLINLLILICAYSTTTEIPILNDIWNNLAIDCIKNGSSVRIRPNKYSILYEIFNIYSCFPYIFDRNPLHILQRISDSLYYRFKNSSICQKMSPNMPRPILVDYNKQMKLNYKNDLKN